MLETLKWTDSGVLFIDQTKLPTEELWVCCANYEAVADAIRTMIVRGAPAIGVAAAMGIALGVRDLNVTGISELRNGFGQISRVMGETRPTAVNLFWAIRRMQRRFEEVSGNGIPLIKQALVDEALAVYAEDIATNLAMGAHGAALMPNRGGVLTHCNAGALATAGYGTALGVIRAAVEAGKKIHVYADETRPFLQGARLTAWELMKDNIPVTLISDSMATTHDECDIRGGDVFSDPLPPPPDAPPIRRPWRGRLFGHDLPDPGPLHQAVEHNYQRLLILVGELIDFLIEPVQLMVVNDALAGHVLPAGELIQADT